MDTVLISTFIVNAQTDTIPLDLYVSHVFDDNTAQQTQSKTNNTKCQTTIIACSKLVLIHSIHLNCSILSIWISIKWMKKGRSNNGIQYFNGL